MAKIVRDSYCAELTGAKERGAMGGKAVVVSNDDKVIGIRRP
jgi:hypothetical protein